MTVTLQHGGLATIFGGSGFVGRHTTRALARRGWRVRAAVRRPDLAGHLQPMGNVGQIHAVQANLRYPASLGPALEGADVAVIAVGQLTPSGAQSYSALQVDGPRAVARAARERGVARLVHISAIGADAAGAASYARTKAEGEAAVLAEFPEAVILRPSIVFGPEDRFFNRFAEMAAMGPALPLIAGETRFQPVFVGDLAEAIANAVEGKARPGTIYEIGGPEIMSMREILERTVAWSGRRTGLAPIAIPVAKLLALLTWPLPASLRPLTVDQVRMLQHDNLVSDSALADGRTLAGLGVSAPTAAGAVVPTYLERFRPRGQFSHYRG
ncbi:MAG: complex I NDUFA9 subunit family protein [Hyphomicrobiaceae bacterium]